MPASWAVPAAPATSTDARANPMNNAARDGASIDLKFDAGKPEPARGWRRRLFVCCALVLGGLAPAA